MLHRIIYVSCPSPDFHNGDIRSILEASRRNNPPRAVSGMLLFNSGFFLQWLEGSRSSINERFETILADPRHEKVEILNYQPVPNREFASWGMGYLGEGKLNADVFYRFSTGEKFDPYDLSSDSAVAFLREASERGHELK